MEHLDTSGCFVGWLCISVWKPGSHSEESKIRCQSSFQISASLFCVLQLLVLTDIACFSWGSPFCV
jgi:hypothetical protein